MRDRACVQRAVDSLTVALGRPAVIENPDLELLAASPHDKAGDEVRRASLSRGWAAPEVAAWLRRRGVFDSGRAVRLPACPELNMLPRVCVPVRAGDALLGFLWLLDATESMSEAEVTLAELVADRLAALLPAAPADPVRDLLATDRSVRAEAARLLVAQGRFPATGVLAVAGPRRPGPIRGWPGLRLRLEDHEVLLLPESAARCAELFADSLGAPVGVGAPRPGLAEAADTVREALDAAGVAARLPELGRVLRWPELGIYRLLSQLSATALSRASVHPGLERLFTEEAGPHLLHTLETYLDLGGNVPVAAARLHLHRATLYYRLRRIEELTGADLRDGGDRLCLHTALKLGRLAGRYPATGVAAAARVRDS
ncbi:helix-turn-helix domain-containing protein [Crossiella sp. SN42]|uniref:PucR family transcriptional regulator n=1 Tax=Crossiella sp. SN42 TaxID=2944808 RepID=UPI00207C7353|nr:helix-turn-helix domain-containing protein [Crossiella sp. SN42]MCO1574345.1 helix-turn-helix domain-containing protein [Crossiella sp. SN42]